MDNEDIDPMIILTECVSNLQNHSNSVSLQSAIQALQQYPENEEDDPSMPVRWIMIDHLVENCDIVSHCLNDMNSRLKANRSSADISDHIAFLLYICNNHNIEFDEQQISQIYNSFPVKHNDAFDHDHELLFELLLNIFQGEITNNNLVNCIHKISPMTQKLFTEYLTPYFNDILHVRNLNKHGFRLFSLCFLLTNHANNACFIQNLAESDVFIVLDYDTLIGVDILWNIIIYCEHAEVTAKASKLYNKLLNKLSPDAQQQTVDIHKNTLKRIMSSLHETSDSDSKLSLLKFLHKLLDETEAFGLKGLKKHSALIEGECIVIDVINAIDWNGYGPTPHFGLDVYENNTLWQLKKMIATKTNIYMIPEMVRIYINGAYIDINSKTLIECDIRNGSKIRCSKVDKHSLRVPLLMNTPPEMTPKCKETLEIIWKRFATHEINGKLLMDYDDMRKYILNCGAGENSASRSRVNAVFNRYPRGSHGFGVNLFAFEGFLDFYYQACKDRPDHVWNDFEVQGFRYDLKKIEDVKQEEKGNEADGESLSCYMISNDDVWFHDLCGVCINENGCEESRIIELTSELMFRIPTNPSMKKMVCDMDNDWSQWMEINNLHMMMYYALIWESMIFTRNKEWITSFLWKKKGFDYLFKILFLLSYNEDNSFWTKRILRMIHSFHANDVSFNPLMSNILCQFTYFDEEELVEYGVNQDKNSFMHFICLSSKYKDLTYDRITNGNVTFYKDGVLPPDIVSVYVAPLIFGYAHEAEIQCSLTQNVSLDILQILLRFFL